MTQAQLDFQSQLEQSTNELITKPLFNDTPALFLESVEESTTYLPEQVERHKTSPQDPTPSETFPLDQSHESPPPPKRNNRS